MTLTQLRQLFHQYSIHPNKRLGQNFLYDPNMIGKMLRAMEISKKDVVVEVGPGAGALTEGLAEKAKEVWAVEIDRGLVKILKERFRHLKNLHIIHGDILEWDFSELIEEKLMLVGNLPYQISSPFLGWVIEHRNRVSRVFITVQSEFAKRMVAKPGTHEVSSLSCLVQMYTRPEVLFRVPRAVFYPSPEVDSAFVRLTILQRPAIPVEDEQFFHTLIRKGFSHRRKTLVNVLTKELGISPESIESLLKELGLRLDIRAERLTLQQWCWLSDRLK